LWKLFNERKEKEKEKEKKKKHKTQQSAKKYITKEELVHATLAVAHYLNHGRYCCTTGPSPLPSLSTSSSLPVPSFLWLGGLSSSRWTPSLASLRSSLSSWLVLLHHQAIAVTVLVYVLVAASSVVFVAWGLVVVALDAVVGVIEVIVIVVAGVAAPPGHRRRHPRLPPRRCPFCHFCEFLHPHCAGRRCCHSCWNRKVEKIKLKKGGGAYRLLCALLPLQN
jgi:hypothetical protein